MQPTYLPWIGYFDLINKSDVFVFLDNVQLSKQSWQTRNKIKTQNGVIWLSLIYEKTKEIKERYLNDIKIRTDLNWKEKHLRSINFSYLITEHFSEIYNLCKELINNENYIISDFNIFIIKRIAQSIGINKEFIKSSELRSDKSDKINYLVNICKELDCDKYLSTIGTFDYLKENNNYLTFKENDIDLYLHNYIHPTYEQINGKFIPYMSVIDLLFNEGIKKALNIIINNNSENIPFEEYLIKHN